MPVPHRSHFWNPAFSDAFILDWDGVLAETKLNFSLIREKYFQGRFVPLFEASSTLPLPAAEELKRDIYNEEMAGAANAEPVPGAFELLEWLDRSGIPWCIVSRNCSDSILLAAERTGIPLPPILFSRDTPPVKPEPEALWKAAEQMHADSSRCVMVGDFVFDLVGARRAGMRAVLVQRPQVEWKHWADASFDKLTDFVEFLKAPKPLIPWEYRSLEIKAGGPVFLDSLAVRVLSVSSIEEKVLPICLHWAAKGILFFHIEGESSLTTEQWLHMPGLSPIWLDQPVGCVLEHLLHMRYPLAGIVKETDGLEPFTPQNGTGETP